MVKRWLCVVDVYCYALLAYSMRIYNSFIFPFQTQVLTYMNVVFYCIYVFRIGGSEEVEQYRNGHNLSFIIGVSTFKRATSSVSKCVLCMCVCMYVCMYVHIGHVHENCSTMSNNTVSWLISGKFDKTSRGLSQCFLFLGLPHHN